MRGLAPDGSSRFVRPHLDRAKNRWRGPGASRADEQESKLIMVDDAVRKISRALAKVDHGHLRAFADDDRVILVVQDAPQQLRRLADALEKVNVNEIQAMIAYTRPDGKTIDLKDVETLPSGKRRGDDAPERPAV